MNQHERKHKMKNQNFTFPTIMVRQHCKIFFLMCAFRCDEMASHPNQTRVSGNVRFKLKWPGTHEGLFFAGECLANSDRTQNPQTQDLVSSSIQNGQRPACGKFCTRVWSFIPPFWLLPKIDLLHSVIGLALLFCVFLRTIRSISYRGRVV